MRLIVIVQAKLNSDDLKLVVIALTNHGKENLPGSVTEISCKRVYMCTRL